jgi:hypothetical protein
MAVGLVHSLYFMDAVFEVDEVVGCEVLGAPSVPPPPPQPTSASVKMVAHPIVFFIEFPEFVKLICSFAAAFFGHSRLRTRLGSAWEWDAFRWN